MKKSFILSVLFLFFTGFAFASIDPNLIFKESYNQSEYSNLDIQLSFEDITFNEVYGSEIIIEIFCNNSSVMPDVFTEDNTIKIASKVKNNSIGNICRILVYIPQEKTMGDVSISAASGDLRLKKFSAEKLTAQTSSGDIDGQSVVITNSIVLTSSSGDIDVEKLFADSIIIKTTSGDIDTDTLTSPELKVTSTSGDIDCEHSKTEYFLALSRSGKIGAFTTVTDYFEITSTSGEVTCQLEKAPAAKSSITTTSGSISLEVDGFDGYTVFVDSRKDYSRDFNGGGPEIYITTRSGGIEFN